MVVTSGEWTASEIVQTDGILLSFFCPPPAALDSAFQNSYQGTMLSAPTWLTPLPLVNRCDSLSLSGVC
jgi:hypothetical protein